MEDGSSRMAAQQSSPYETLGKINFASVLDQALQSVVAGYRAAALFPFDADAVHYERVTASNRSKYDSQAFMTTGTSSVIKTDDQVAVRRMEAILGGDIVSVHNSLLALPVITDTMLPNINAYSILRLGKSKDNLSRFIGTEGSSVTHDTSANMQMNSLVISELTDK